jgi:CheY-like chemotaxis protein
MAKIVIVDDERAIQLILQAVLRSHGHELLVAGDAVTGLALIVQNMPDLVILDDMLPDMNGSELCHRLKSDPATRHIPVLLYSASHRMRDYKHLAAIGANGALEKPTASDELVRKVTELLAARI